MPFVAAWRIGVVTLIQSRPDHPAGLSEQSALWRIRADADGPPCLALRRTRAEQLTAKHAAAQAARIAVDKAQAEQQQAQVEAQTKVIEAQGVADANAVLAKSLTPEVLQQKYIDALSKASTVYVVPAGSTPMVGIGSALAPTPATTNK